MTLDSERKQVRDQASVTQEHNKIADRICLSVAEIPDRFSPDDQPEMMLVTPDELREIVLQSLGDSQEQTIQQFLQVLRSAEECLRHAECCRNDESWLYSTRNISANARALIDAARGVELASSAEASREEYLRRKFDDQYEVLETEAKEEGK